MYKPRTNIDWSNHVLNVLEHKSTDDRYVVKIYDLFKPNPHDNGDNLLTGGLKEHRVKLVNCEGKCTISGDFGTWVVDREIHPDTQSHISDDYIAGNIVGKAYQLDDAATERHIIELKNKLNEEGLDDLESWEEYYDECLDYIGYEEFDCKIPCIPDWDYPELKVEPVYIIHRWLQAVFDAVEYMHNEIRKQKSYEKLPV
jgi:hypothetical protein